MATAQLGVGEVVAETAVDDLGADLGQWVDDPRIRRADEDAAAGQ
jgi:hypothetical protein